jgi:hypothetical protein
MLFIGYAYVLLYFRPGCGKYVATYVNKVTDNSVPSLKIVHTSDPPIGQLWTICVA